MNENPYAAPQSETTPPLPVNTTVSSPYGAHFREVGGLRVTILILLTGICIASAVQIYTLAALNEANALSEESDDYWEEIDQLIEQTTQIGAFYGILFFTNVIIWCIWKNKSCKNAWLFRSNRPAEANFHGDIPTPGWAAGSYFIPIANLWIPFKAMAFIRNQLTSKMNFGPLLGLWWTSWVVMNFASNYFGRTVTEFSTTEEAIAYNQGLMIDSGISIVSAILAGLVIHKLTEGQNLVARDLGLIPGMQGPDSLQERIGLS